MESEIYETNPHIHTPPKIAKSLNSNYHLLNSNHSDLEQLQESVEEQALTLHSILEANHKLLTKMDLLQATLAHTNDQVAQAHRIIEDKDTEIQAYQHKLEQLSAHT